MCVVCCVCCVDVVIVADATAKRNEHAYNNTTTTTTPATQSLKQHETYKYSASTIIISARADSERRSKPGPSASSSSMASPIRILIKRTCYDAAAAVGHVISWRSRLLPSQVHVYSHLERKLVTPRRMRMRATCCHLVVLPKCGSVLHIISYLSEEYPFLSCPATILSIPMCTQMLQKAFIRGTLQCAASKEAQATLLRYRALP